MTTVRLPDPGGDEGQWGAILNEFLEVEHNDDGTLKLRAEKGQPNGYPMLDNLGGLDVIGQAMRVGPTDYPYAAGISSGGANSSYVVIDKASTAANAALLFRDQGNIRAEAGLVGDNDFHLKTATGNSGSEVFSDQLVVKSTGTSWFSGKLGVGTVPSASLHVASDGGSSRTILEVENTASSGSFSSAVELVGSGIDWSIGTDAGVNGSNNFYINDNINGYLARLLIDSNGNVAIGKYSASFKLDVSGSIGITSVGAGLSIATGANATIGTAVLVAGTITVATTAVDDNSNIFLTTQIPGGTVGTPYILSRISGTSFTIKSTSSTDTSTVSWVIIKSYVIPGN